MFLFWELRGLSPPHSRVCERFMCIFPGSVHIFPPTEKADPSWEYIIRSQTHECGTWDWDPDISFLGIFVSNFRHFVFAVQPHYRYQLNICNQNYIILLGIMIFCWEVRSWCSCSASSIGKKTYFQKKFWKYSIWRVEGEGSVLAA